MNPVQRTTAFLLLAFLVGCASLGLPTPETFKERLAAGYVTVTEVRNTTTALLQSGKINAEDAQNIQNQCDNLRAGLDISRSISGTDLTAANNRLTAVITALTALQAYTATRGH